MLTKESIVKLVLETNPNICEDDIVVEVPKDRTMGDYAVPCFMLAKKLHQNPNMIAEDIINKINNTDFDKIELKNGYINFFLKRNNNVKNIIDKVLEEKENYGSSNIGLDKTIVIDYSAPNIAKPFGVGHLRSTVIGNAIRNICNKLGFKTVGINYLGDFGTQFGKLIYAYENWADKDKVKQNPIAELNKLYVRFHEEAENNPALDDEARRIFKELEEGDVHYQELWNWFREESIKEFMKTYELLNITNFDSWSGESFYAKKGFEIIKELEDKNLLTQSEGAMIVDLGSAMLPALVKRSDGASLYITRDIAAVLDRYNKYNFAEALYVVGNEQTLHFKQLKMVIDKMGYPFSDKIHHIPFGLILNGGKRMKTRGGSAVALSDLLDEAIKISRTYVENHEIKDIDLVSKQIGVGAVIFNDLKNYRMNDIEFKMEDILKFEGETGPYLQYTCARINSLLAHKIDIVINYNEVNIDDYVWNIVFKLSEFENTIIRAKEGYDPSVVAKYLLELSGLFNKLYANTKIIEENLNNSKFKLDLSQAVYIVLKEGLKILGISVPDKM